MQTINDLRNFILEEMNRLKNQESTPASANAAANLAGKVISSVKMELEYNKMVGATPSIPFLNKNVANLLESHKETSNAT